jgi:fructokinase
MTIYGAIEAGGTKFLCGIGNARSGSIETVTIPTRDPDATFADVEHFFRRAQRHGAIKGIGIASFGPVELRATSELFGQILATPKPQWEGTDMIARTRAIIDAPMAIDTDVNAAALAEAAAAGPDITQLAYVTVGTGIGIGLVSGGQPVHGLGHPEAGHILPRRHPAHEGFAGICPFHGDCLEGLASGPALAAAWGQTPSHFSEDHPFWEVQPHYLAQLCMTLFLTMAPERIVLGGGVMKQERLFPLIHQKTAELLAGYFGGAASVEEMAERIVPPLCVEPPGLIGAYLLAERGEA